MTWLSVPWSCIVLQFNTNTCTHYLQSELRSDITYLLYCVFQKNLSDSDSDLEPSAPKKKYTAATKDIKKTTVTGSAKNASTEIKKGSATGLRKAFTTPLCENLDQDMAESDDSSDEERPIYTRQSRTARGLRRATTFPITQPAVFRSDVYSTRVSKSWKDFKEGKVKTAVFDEEGNIYMNGTDRHCNKKCKKCI